MTLQTDLMHSRQAQELLDHPMLKQAFDALEKEIFDVWANDTKSTHDRELAYSRHKAVQWLKAYLNARIDGGKVAQKELDRLEKRQSKS